MITDNRSGLIPGSAHCTGTPRGSGWDSGRTNCLTHALPRCLPTPTGKADGNGYGVITGRSDPPGPPSRVSVNQVPLLLTGVRLHPPGRTDKNLCRCFGAPATHARRPHGRVFPDHLIITATLEHALYPLVSDEAAKLARTPAASTHAPAEPRGTGAWRR